MKTNDEIVDTLLELKNEQNLTLSELARRVNMAKSALSRYFNKTREFPLNNVDAFAKALHTTPEYILGFKENEIGSLTDSDRRILRINKMLSSDRQEKVYNYASDQLNEQNNEKITSMFDHKPMIEIPSGRSTAAGSPINGEDQDTQLIHKLIAGEKVPAGADELVTVDGDSMEPLLKKGSQVFIHYQPEVENGEIAIVHIRDVGVTCKKFYVNEDNTVTLKSINNAYDDMVFDCDEVNVIGKVIL